MRQGQNNSKRSRGRGRKPQQHSTNRAYDSNGPDVKVRGTAATVCEKYQQLARDAISVGDRVMAENYYQHAEHYYRLLMAAQLGQEGQQRQQSSLGYRPDEDEENESENENDYLTDGPQPRHPGQPWHQQEGQSNNGGRNGSNNNSGQTNGRRDEPFDGSDENDEEDDAAASAQANGRPQQGQPQGGEQGEGQPRRRQNRRRRPRGEPGAQGGAQGGERSGDAPRAETAPAPVPAADNGAD
ncbi:MAG: DUF4167 domain-containing protein [Parvibaculum sp.]